MPAGDIPSPEDAATLARILEQTPVAAYVVDVRERRIEFVSSSLFSQLGYPADRGADKAGDLMLKLMHPDDRARFEEWPGEWDEVDDEGVLEWEYRLRHADGSWRWFAGREKVFERDADGRVTRVLGSAPDVTDFKRSERELSRLSLLATHTDNAVAIMNKAGEVEWINYAFTRLTG